MAERCSRGAGSESGRSGEQGEASSSGTRRVVPLRATSRPQPAAAPAWAGPPDEEAGGWIPQPPRGASASALAESVFPFGSELPFEPDAEAAAFLNAPRRPLAFHVAPFGTPPFGNPPSGPRSVFGGPLDPGRGAVEAPMWGPAYPAGA